MSQGFFDLDGQAGLEENQVLISAGHLNCFVSLASLCHTDLSCYSLLESVAEPSQELKRLATKALLTACESGMPGFLVPLSPDAQAVGRGVDPAAEAGLQVFRDAPRGRQDQKRSKPLGSYRH